jgi:hypothetical protein
MDLSCDYLLKYRRPSEAHYCAKSTLEKLENVLAIVGSSKRFWGLAAIPSEQLGANLVQ